MKNGGGWAAIKSSMRMANRVGSWRLWKAVSAKNACKTCALGMGGQRGGMRVPVGAMHGIRARPFDIRAGNAAIHYPEANLLVCSVVDPESKTAAFKCVAISVEPEPATSDPALTVGEGAGTSGGMPVVAGEAHVA
jgi:hypothetical protein